MRIDRRTNMAGPQCIFVYIYANMGNKTAFICYLKNAKKILRCSASIMLLMLTRSTFSPLNTGTHNNRMAGRLHFKINFTLWEPMATRNYASNLVQIGLVAKENGHADREKDEQTDRHDGRITRFIGTYAKYAKTDFKKNSDDTSEKKNPSEAPHRTYGWHVVLALQRGYEWAERQAV